MKIAYRAENVIDAHLMRGLFEHEGIAAVVTGDFLTGGIGELPVIGLVSVLVADDDLPRARELVEMHERASLADESSRDEHDDAPLGPAYGEFPA